MPKEGDIGTTPDGRKVIFMDGAARFMDEGGFAHMGDGYRKDRQGRVYYPDKNGKPSQVGGPTDGQITDAFKSNNTFNNALASLDRVDTIATTKKPKQGPLGKYIANQNDFAQLQAAVKDYQIQMKEAYNLGAITGPDMQFIDAMATDPKSLEAAYLSGTLRTKLTEVAHALGTRSRNNRDTFGGLGGRSVSMPNIYRSPNSTYTPEEWGTDARVPASVYGGERGARRPTAPARPSAAAAAKEYTYDAQGRRSR